MFPRFTTYNYSDFRLLGIREWQFTEENGYGIGRSYSTYELAYYLQINTI